MAEKLQYLGDKATFQVSAGKVDSIDGIAKVISSTKDANISSNNIIFFDRLDARFRTSLNDGKTYSDWYDLEDFELDNVKSFANVFVDANVVTNVEIQYKLINVPDDWDEDVDYIEVGNVSVTSTVSSITTEMEVINTNATVSAIGNDQGLEYEQNHYYNPYELTEVEKLSDDLSFMTMEMYGHQVDYIKVRSNTDKGRDVTLREYNLYGVKAKDVKCIKVVVPDNQFPDNQFQFNQWGVDYPEIFEIHINNTYWKKIFNDEATIPQQRDYLYFPLVNRIYEVSSVYMKKTINMKPNYWVLTLSKWEDRKDIVYADDTDVHDKILEKADGLEKLFGTDVKKEADDVVDKDQLKLNDNDLDTVRNYINSKLLFKDERIENYFTLISDTQYDLNSIWKLYGTDKLAISYKSKFNVVKDKATTLTLLANLEKVISRPVNCTMTLYSGSTYKIIPAVGKFHDGYKVGDMLTVWKKDGYNKKYLNVLEITSINNDRDELFCELYDVESTIDPIDVELVSVSVIRTLMFSGSNDYDMVTRVRSYTEDTLANRFKVFITENDAIHLEYFGNIYTFKLDDKLNELNYYGFIFSFNLKFNMFGLSVYEILGDGTSAEMPLVQSFSIENFTNETKTSGGVLNLLSSPLRMTNIRLFDEHLESDLHSGYLSRNIIDNASDIMIVDNAELNLKLYNYYVGEIG